MSTLNHKPLNCGFNACVHTMAKIVWPQCFDVNEVAPDTLEKLQSEYARRGRITVWSGGSDATIFDDAGTNHAFRAWHDYCHLTGNFAFTIEGETQAALMQCDQIRKRYGNGETGNEFCAIVMAEVIGQARYQEAHGDFPVDQMGFTRAYLDNPSAALAASF